MPCNSQAAIRRTIRVFEFSIAVPRCRAVSARRADRRLFVRCSDPEQRRQRRRRSSNIATPEPNAGRRARRACSAARTGAGGWLSPDAKKKGNKSLIYWGNYDTSTITIYSGKGVNGKEVGQITTGLSSPERLFVGADGSVYATNLDNNTITGYKAGKTSPFITISNGVNTPTGLTVDAAGTVYCANVGNDTITVYPKGQTTPSLTISYFAEYLATDKHDNLYAAGAPSKSSRPARPAAKTWGSPLIQAHSKWIARETSSCSMVTRLSTSRQGQPVRQRRSA